MILKSLKLKNFRNYHLLTLDFNHATNIFYGDNAQGKTNILEAVYLCGTTKSHRGTKDRDMIQFGKEESHIEILVEKDGVPYQIDVHLKKNSPKGIAIDKIPIRKASELFGMIHLVFFSPEDLNIIKNGPAERRRFMDMELSLLDKIYLSNLSSYNRIVNQRNKLLKEIVGTIHQKLTGERENLVLSYEPGCGNLSLEEAVRKNRERDIRMRSTSTGPHRDDICFLADDLDIRKFGSQGQQRTAALSLKLSEIELVKQVLHDTPVLLLDDVLSELDKHRQNYLLDSIQGVQTLVTCTGLDEFVNHRFSMNKVFHVKDGEVTGEN